MSVLDDNKNADGTFNYPTTPEGWCEWFKALDAKFNTHPDEIPLGHNVRCPIHGRKNKS